MPIHHKKKGGFTLIEAIITFAIVAVIMSTVLFDYGTFNDNLFLSSAGQELAVTIRQAQTYGLTVKEVSVGGGRFTSAYGVFFDVNDPTHYYLFADITNDKKYYAGDGCGTGPANTDCIEKITFRNNIEISDICNESTCDIPSATAMNVTFLRPNPDANVYFTDSGVNFVGKTPPTVGYFTGRVVLVSPKGKTLTVTVESTGQVLVGQIQ